MKKKIAQAVANNARRDSYRLAWLASVLSLPLTSVAVAQEQESSKLLDLEEVVVLGTPGGAGIRKLDASFAITSVDNEGINKFAPKSTADLFKSVPGVWSESSGGVSGANVQVRGLPSPGDATFVTVSINGSPVYGAPSLSFFENSTLFRVDETIERMEALRGGPNPVFATGQPGLTTNFVLKEGGEETEGLIKYTTSDYDLNRVDAVVSGKLTSDLYYMVGGYVRRSPGIRDAQFTSERGEQFTINLTKELENGKINLYTRSTDDTGGFYAAIPLGNNLDGISGFDAGTGTYIGNDMRFADIAVNSNGETKSYDLADGRGADIVITGLNVELELANGWTVRDNMNYMSGNANTIALFNGDTNTAADWAGGVASFGSAQEVTSGRALTASTLVSQVGFWAVEKELESFTNDLSFSKSFFNETHAISVGMYTASYSARDFWSLGNNHYVTATTNSRRVDIRDAGDNSLTFNGRLLGASGGAFYSMLQKGDADTRAFYIADSWSVNEAVTVDLGVRHESVDIEFAIDGDGGSSATLPNGITSSAPDGVIDTVKSVSESDVSMTFGVNWALNDVSGVFFRANQGHLFPTFETTRGAGETEPQVQDINQYEVGYKLGTDNLGLFATLFFNEYQASQQRIVDSTVLIDYTESEATGLELEAEWNTEFGFALNVNATLLDAEYTKSTTEGQKGKKPQRVPDWQVRISPSYELDLGDAQSIVFYGALTAVDDRFSDPENKQAIDGYEKIDLGAVWYLGESLSAQLSIDNVTDEVGLTEGDARVIGEQQGVLKGRPIMGRSTRFSVSYNF